ncbi:MAG TPA: dienelactone hydrolase family protein [Acidimicrobiales bacterium]
MVTTRDVEYDAEGTVMVGRLALPDGTAKRPAVLIAHEGPGLDDFQRGRADQLAELGYAAFALDYHGSGRWLEDRDEMMTRLGVLGADPERTRTLARAGLDVLLAEPRADGSNVAAIGYCFGGTVALELARGGAELKAVVGFHPGLSTVRPEDAANIRGKVLVFVGSEDPFIPLDQRLAFEDEMRAGGVDWEMVLYGGVEHSFTHPSADPNRTGLPGIRYNEDADRRSWKTMLELFDEVFA